MTNVEHCRCGQPSRTSGSYCLTCHAAYQRNWRKTHPLSPEAKKRDIARSYAGTYKRRGRLVPQPCISCSATQSQMHHPDYSQPLAVQWLCRPCHLQLHKAQEKGWLSSLVASQTSEQQLIRAGMERLRACSPNVSIIDIIRYVLFNNINGLADLSHRSRAPV